MATKINPDFYGGEDTFVSILRAPNIKASPHTINDLVSLGVYDGGNLDATASPWGIGESSVSSQFAYFPTSGQYWTMFDTHNDKKNTPLFITYSLAGTDGFGSPSSLVGAAANNANFTKAVYKNRTAPDTTISNNEIQSTMAVDDTARVDLPNTTKLQYVTYLDYQKVRIYVSMVYYVEPNSTIIKDTTLDMIINHNVSVGKIIGFSWNIRDADENVYDAPIRFSVGSFGLPIPEEYKTCYYGDADTWVRPWRMIDIVGHWNRLQNSSMAFSVFNTTDVINTSSFDDVNANDNVRGYMAVTGWGSMSRKHQVFDDVSYHWEYGTATSDSDINNLHEVKTGDLYQSGTYFNFSYMKLDGEYDDKNIAYANAILHELAFIGLPFCRKYADGNKLIGDNDIYVPVFDEHNITTGDFKYGTDAITLPNAIWGDIFGAEMPEYDPTYEPDEPIPVDDYGDTTNTGKIRVRIPSDLKVYLMDESTLHQMLYRLNNYYSDKTPDDWTIDFQGVNPSDYILGCYVTRLNLPPSSVGEAVKIGVIDLNLSAYTLNQVYDYWCTIDFGTRTIQPRYNDFRDYAPYTSVELYLPLAGTVDLDVNYCMGHNITVKYYYDVLTMSCVAAVYRDNMLYKCSDCKIGAEIPLLSSNMGSYQNQIEQLSVARQRNNIAIATSGAAAIAGTTAAIATGSPMAIIGAAGGFSKLADNIIDSSNLDYQFDHIAPSVSVTGAADAQNNLCVGQLMPKLIIKRPVMLSGHNDTVYSKTVGNACCINDYIGSRTGLIVCSNINANDIVNACGESPTADEINSIKQAFANGVYV